MSLSLSNTERILNNYKNDLGKDFQPYLGHCSRVLRYMSELGLKEEDEELASVLVAFHDLGIWTDDTMDYLEPSVLLAIDYIQSEGLDIDPETTRLVIGDHHKVTATSNPVAELLRKADLIDLTMGMIRFGVPKQVIKETRIQIPYLGFHSMITKKTLQHAVRNPLNPFPMLKA